MLAITENGFCSPGEQTVEQALNDTTRTHYYHGYLSALVNQVKTNNANMIAYFAWSFVDNFEWARGYTERFGITFVDYTTMKRTPKGSAKFLSAFFKNTIKAQGEKDDVIAKPEEPVLVPSPSQETVVADAEPKTEQLPKAAPVPVQEATKQPSFTERVTSLFSQLFSSS